MKTYQDYRLPERPSALQPILVLSGALLIGSLPQWLQGTVHVLAGIDVPEPLVGVSAQWTMPLIAVSLIGSYAIFLQWIDRRRYDVIFSCWSRLAEDYGFRPISELVFERTDSDVLNVIIRAQKLRRFMFEESETESWEENIHAAIHSTKNYGLVRLEAGKIFVHPDLIMRTEEPNKAVERMT